MRWVEASEAEGSEVEASEVRRTQSSACLFSLIAFSVIVFITSMTDEWIQLLVRLVESGCASDVAASDDASHVASHAL